MKDFRFKLLAGIFTFIIGVTAFYLVSKLKPEIFDIFCTASAIEEVPMPELEEVKFSEQIEVRFIKFFRGNYDDIAQLEVTNNSSQNAYYLSYSKTDYPFAKLKRGGSIVHTNIIHCRSGLKEQTLKPGETIKFSVPKSEFVNEYKEGLIREIDQPTQIGFPFQIGEGGFSESKNKEETYFWSGEIKFSNKSS